jgi:hypothetical protein
VLISSEGQSARGQPSATNNEAPTVLSWGFFIFIILWRCSPFESACSHSATLLPAVCGFLADCHLPEYPFAARRTEMQPLLDDAAQIKAAVVDLKEQLNA